jgi:iron complex outermembrane recepter protein
MQGEIAMKRSFSCAANRWVALVGGFGGAVVQAATPPATTPLEEVIVSGVRQSVESAIAIKQESLQISDSIVAEDIGKLPDNSVAEALQRVPGVQIARARSDASLVLIRGLPNVVTTINGRQLFTTTGRGVALADIPADLLKQVDVYKTQTADMYSGGLVGAINVDLRRPFDFEDFAVAGALRGIYSENTEDVDPIASALISNRWDVGDGEFGAMLSVSHQDKNYQEANTFDGTYDRIEPPNQPATPGDQSDDILRPFVIGSIYTLGETQRDSANLSLQWRPNDRATFHFDGFYVKYEEDYELNFWIPLPGIQVDSYTLKPGSNVAQTWNSSDIFTLTSNQAFGRESETYQLALGGDWAITDRLTLKSDIAYTNSTADNRGVILDTGFIAPRLEVDFSQNGASNARVLNADGSPFDVADSSHYWLEQLFDQRDAQEGDDVTFRADLAYDTDGFFTQFAGGLQVSSRSASESAANGGGVNRNRFAPPGVDNLVFVDDVEARTGLAGIQDVSPNDILDGDRDLWTRQWFVADRDYLLNNTAAVRELFYLSPNDPPDDPARFFDDQEDTYAVYLQTNFEFDLGSLPVDGVLGVRYVQIDSELNGFQFRDVGGGLVQTPVSIQKTDEELLPSLNMRFKLREDLFLRFSASETAVRPDFNDLNPATTLTAPGPTLPGQGTGGNPDLENQKALNGDLTLEWYFGDGGLLSGGVFYRDIENYVQIFSATETIGGQDFEVSRPRGTDATLEGVELSYTQFFDMLPGFWSGFGTQVNYTLVNSEADTPDLRTDPVTFRKADVTNVSDDSYNIILIYEQYGVSARLAYNWRSDYIESYNQSGAQPPAVVVKDAAQMDFSLGYDINEHITVQFDATNLLDRPVLNYFGGESGDDDHLYPRDVRSNDRTFSLGVRARL